MSFLLAEAPGFTDLSDNLLTADSAFATGFIMSAIKDDIAAGTVMPEIFSGFYTNGQQVPLPISSTDGYQYQRNELLYVWEVMNTTNTTNGLPGANGGYYWGQYNVDQSTGNVSCTTAYYIPGGAQANTNDGVLKVTTIAVRGKQLRKMTAYIAGSLTSGTFQLGERIVQSTSGATAYVDPGSALPGAGINLTVLQAVMGVPDATHTWIGSASGAVYTPTAIPSPFPLKYSVTGVISSGTFQAGETVTQASTGATAILTLPLPQSWTGVVDVSGTAVTLVSGSNFVTGAQWNNAPIVINGVNREIASVTSTTALILTATGGTQTNVAYSAGTMFLLGPIAGSPNSINTWSGGTSGAVFAPATSPAFISARYTDLLAASWDTDAPLAQTVTRDLTNNARLSTVRMEAFLTNPSNAPLWTPNTNYTAGQLIQPTGRWANGCWYACALTGVSGTVEPGPWPSELSQNGPVGDGSTLWNVAGAGYMFGQQVPLPVSPFDGYEYSQEEIYVVMPFFITTLALPIQRGVDIVWNGGRGDVRALSKNISSTAPATPSYLPAGTQAGDVTGATLYTQWNPTNPNASNYAVAGALTSGTFQIGETATQTTSGATAAVGGPVPDGVSIQLIFDSPITGTPDATDTWVGGTSGAVYTPTATPAAIGSAEVYEPALSAPTTPTTGCGFVNNAVWFQDGAYAQGALNVLVIACRALGRSMAAPGGAAYVDFATDNVLSGEPLPTAEMQDMNENAKFAILRPEVFMEFDVGPGTTTPTPASPWDGYVYSPSECQYLEWWTNTGAAPGDLRDFSVQVNPQNGVMQTRTDYYRGAGWNIPLSFGLITFGPSSSIATAMYGYPGSPVYTGMPVTGTWGVPTINVAVIGSRSRETEEQNVQLIATPGNTSPAPPGNGNLLPNAGYESWSLPGSTAIAVAGVADDWYTDEHIGTTAFLQEAGLLPGSNYAQGIGAKYTAQTLSGRSTTNPQNRASIQSMRVPIDPTGVYSFAFIAQASPQVINYGFYCRVHLLDNTLSNDTQFELLWPGQIPATIPGSITSGTFLVGEEVVQGTTGATTFCAANTAPLQVFGGVVGTPDGTHTWVGQVSGAVFTPSDVPSQSATADESAPPGIGLSDNFGSPLNTSVQVFGDPPYVFQIPANGDSSAATNFGASVLNQYGTPVTLGFTPAYLYFEFDVWSPMNNGGGPGGAGLLFAIVDNCVLMNVTGVLSVPSSGGGVVVGTGTNPGRRGRPIIQTLVNTGGGASTFPVLGVGDGQAISLDTQVANGTTYKKVSDVTSGGQITTQSIDPGAINIRGYTTFSGASITNALSNVASVTLSTLATNDLVYIWFYFSAISSDYGGGAQNFFVDVEVDIDAAGSINTVVYVDYLWGAASGVLVFPITVVPTSGVISLNIALGNGTSGTCTGAFYVGNQTLL